MMLLPKDIKFKASILDILLGISSLGTWVSSLVMLHAYLGIVGYTVVERIYVVSGAIVVTMLILILVIFILRKMFNNTNKHGQEKRAN